MMNGTYDVQVSTSHSQEIEMDRLNIRDDAKPKSRSSNSAKSQKIFKKKDNTKHTHTTTKNNE